MVKKIFYYLFLFIFTSIAFFAINLFKEFLSIPNIEDIKIDSTPLTLQEEQDNNAPFSLISSLDTLSNNITSTTLDTQSNKPIVMASVMVSLKAKQLKECLKKDNIEYIPNEGSCKSSIGLTVHCKNKIVQIENGLQGKKLEFSNVVFECLN